MPCYLWWPVLVAPSGIIIVIWDTTIAKKTNNACLMQNCRLAHNDLQWAPSCPLTFQNNHLGLYLWGAASDWPLLSGVAWVTSNSDSVQSQWLQDTDSKKRRTFSRALYIKSHLYNKHQGSRLLGTCPGKISAWVALWLYGRCKAE